ncbi:MAG: hypothetical protein JNL73_16515 [Anaerolineales bacterium]|nr:hypothetical protein [Anaerolineales bacterium]
MESPGAPDRWRARLVLLAFLSALIVPLALDAQPFTADGRNHILRTLLLERALAGGDWFSRYFPELAFGYGAPLLSYYAPLTYYATALISGLGFRLTIAYQIVLSLSLVLGGVGAAAWAGAWYGQRARLVAGVLWVAAPYVLYNVYTRGAGPEVLGLACLPWLGWALSESLQHGTLRGRLILGGAVAALMLSHNLTALLGCGLMTVIGLAELLVAIRAGHRRALVRRVLWAVAAVALGLASTSFFWAPALLETGSVQMSAATGPAGYDFRGNFLDLTTLLTGAFTYDSRRVLTPVPPSLGWGVLLLGALGALSLILRDPNARLSFAHRALRMRTGVLLLLAVSCIFMTLRASTMIWEALPMAQIIQFPYRWLGPASLFLALVGGRGAAWAQDRLVDRGRPARLAAWLPIALILAMIVLAWPWTFGKPDPTLPADPDIGELFTAEADLGTIGLTSTGEFLPIGAARPTADFTWAQAVYAGTADRVDRAGLPADTTVVALAQARLSSTVQVDGADPVTLRFRWLYWPGWQATLDGVPLAVRASDEHGYVEVLVPAGRHRVEVWLGLTPLRLIASVVSNLAVLTALALVALARRRPFAWRAPGLLEAHPWTASRGMVVAGLMLTATRIGLSMMASPFDNTRYDGQTVRGVAQPLRVVFGDELVLLGIDAPAAANADAGWVLTSYWSLTHPIERDLSFSFQVWDERGRIVAQGDSPNPGGWPTRRWFPGEYAIDTLRLYLDPSAPPGRYRLMVTAYTSVERETLPGRVSEGPLDAYVQVGEIQVGRPSQPVDPAAVSEAGWLSFAAGPFAAVVPVSFPEHAQAGDAVTLDLYWQARSALDGIRPHLEIRDSLGMVHDLGPARLTAADFGESDWRPGDLWRLVSPAIIPADVAPGSGSWQIRVGDEVVTLGAVVLSIPERSEQLPADLLGEPVTFEPFATLAGYRLSGAREPGGVLTVELAWLVREITGQSFTVFVHLIGPDGFPAAQSDAVPQMGRRPTTGWLPPEVILDSHVIALPEGLEPGAYVLTVGLYDPLTGARVVVRPADNDPSGAPRDRVELQTVEVLAR